MAKHKQNDKSKPFPDIYFPNLDLASHTWPKIHFTFLFETCEIRLLCSGKPCIDRMFLLEWNKGIAEDFMKKQTYTYSVV